MDLLGKIIIFILVLSFFVFVTFFGRLPALRGTPVAGLHRLLWVHIPNAINRIDQALTSGKVTRALSWLYNRILYERHPTIVIFFLLIMSVAEYMFIPQVWPLVGWFTKFTAIIAIVLPYVFLYLACSSDPGYITAENHAYYMSLYPYDHAAFHPGNECRTCRFLKPPRSKHCNICKRCIARADHHCVFINSCVGYGNHRWFLLLLLTTCILTTYGGLLGLSLLTTRMKRYYPTWAIWKPQDMSLERYLIIWSWGLRGNIRMGASTLLALLTSPLIWGLFIYTVYLIYCGTTTNESMKWGDLRLDMQDGYAFRRPLATNRPRNMRAEPLCSRWPVVPEHIIMATEDGEPPSEERNLPGQGEWVRIRALKDAENIYDMGLLHNLGDVLMSDYSFGSKAEEPISERKWRQKERNRNSAYPP